MLPSYIQTNGYHHVCHTFLSESLVARHTVAGQQTMLISELCPLDSVIWHSIMNLARGRRGISILDIIDKSTTTAGMTLFRTALLWVAITGLPTPSICHLLNFAFTCVNYSALDTDFTVSSIALTYTLQFEKLLY